MSVQPNLGVEHLATPVAPTAPDVPTGTSEDPPTADRGHGLRLAVSQQAELLALLAASVAGAVGPATGPLADLRPLDTVRLADLAGGGESPGADPLLAFGVVAGQFAQVADRVVADLGGRGRAA